MIDFYSFARRSMLGGESYFANHLKASQLISLRQKHCSIVWFILTIINDHCFICKYARRRLERDPTENTCQKD